MAKTKTGELPLPRTSEKIATSAEMQNTTKSVFTTHSQFIYDSVYEHVNAYVIQEMPNSSVGDTGNCNTIYNTLTNTQQHSSNTDYLSNSETSDTEEHDEETIDVESDTH